MIFTLYMYISESVPEKKLIVLKDQQQGLTASSSAEHRCWRGKVQLLDFTIGWVWSWSLGCTLKYHKLDVYWLFSQVCLRLGLLDMLSVWCQLAHASSIQRWLINESTLLRRCVSVGNVYLSYFKVKKSCRQIFALVINSIFSFL